MGNESDPHRAINLYLIMRILITGICGFVGSALAIGIRENLERVEILGFDNLSPGKRIEPTRFAKIGHHCPAR